MWLRLRQIALVAHELEPIEEQLNEVFGIEVCFRDPGVAHFGLENMLLPIGNQLLEVVAPLAKHRDDPAATAAGRYLARRGGDGGYMVITQCDDHAPRVARVEQLGIRVVNKYATPEYLNMQLHPKDTGGSFFEIDQQLGPNATAVDGPWEPAGSDWQRKKRTDRVTGIVAAELQCASPKQVRARWAEIAQLDDSADMPGLALDNATLRFVDCDDGRGEGLGGIDIACSNPEAVMAAARRLGLASSDTQVVISGTRMNLV